MPFLFSKSPKFHLIKDTEKLGKQNKINLALLTREGISLCISYIQSPILSPQKISN